MPMSNVETMPSAGRGGSAVVAEGAAPSLRAMAHREAPNRLF